MIHSFQVNRWKNKGPWAQEALSFSLKKKIWIHNFIKTNAEKILLRLVDASQKSPENKDMIKGLVSYSKDLVSSSMDAVIRFAPLKMFWLYLACFN